MGVRALAVALLVWTAGCGAPYALRHRVGVGEDLASIATRYGVAETELREFNRLETGDRLRPGDILFIPRAESRGPSAVGASSPVSRETIPTQRPVSPGALRLPVRPPPTPEAAPETIAPRLLWPVQGEILRGFGEGPAGHSRGIDIGVPAGAEVRAAAAGRVTYAGVPARAYGSLVILDHGDGFYTVYSQLREHRVEPDQSVAAGATIGFAGDGAPGAPARLHFEVRQGQTPEDPLLFLPPP